MTPETLQNYLDYLKTVNETAFISFYHGITHWQHVEAFGLLMQSRCPAADKEVIRWFAYLHDSMRGNDEFNMEHGPAAAKFIGKIRKTYLKELSDEQIRLLKLACKYHTSRRKTDDLTINICFDADRLDLPRVGITPEVRRMASEVGRELALIPYQELLEQAEVFEEFQV